jgi:hypothetical protein
VVYTHLFSNCLYHHYAVSFFIFLEVPTFCESSCNQASYLLYLSKAVVPILNSAFFIGIFFIVSCSKPSFGLGSFTLVLTADYSSCSIHTGVNSFQMFMCGCPKFAFMYHKALKCVTIASYHYLLCFVFLLL